MPTESGGKSVAESSEDFTPDKKGWAQRWAMEFNAAKKALKKWHKQGKKIQKRYLDEEPRKDDAETHWNLFASNVETLEALLYGKTPSVDVTRRFSDSQDDVARVAAIVLERALNSDIERENDGYASALEYALQDRLLPGLGMVRLRYVVELEDVPEQPAQTRPMQGPDGQPVLDEQGQPQHQELAPAVPAHQRKAHEDVETDYVHWEDQLWSPARVFHQVRWWAFKTPLSREDLVKRFGEQLGRRIPLNTKNASGQGSGAGAGSENELDAQQQDPWGRADVWEIWDKEHKLVFWYVEGFAEVLDIKPDPLRLDGFWPFPRPMVANPTTSKLVPRPDFILAQDLYDEIDAISTRITRLERAIKVVGVYDKKSTGVQRMLEEGCDNELIPVPNWAMFDDNPISSSIAWLPIQMIVEALNVLREYRTELVNALFQITGMSDIMRGEAQQTATATEQAIKARFGSVRVQRRQDEFARFASDTQRIRGEIICKHFDPETILERSNIASTPDAVTAIKAIEFLKSDYACYRIQVKPESVSLTDYAALKQERTEVIQAIGGYLQVAGPLMQQAPAMMPYLLQILQWLVAGVKGGASIEGIIEQAIAAAKAAMQQAQGQPQQPPKPDPKVQSAQIKAAGDVQKTMAATKGRMVEIAAETQAHIAQRTHDARMSIAEDEAKDRRDAMGELDKVLPPAQGGVR